VAGIPQKFEGNQQPSHRRSGELRSCGEIADRDPVGTVLKGFDNREAPREREDEVRIAFKLGKFRH
jgi:hypothetical protein